MLTSIPDDLISLAEASAISGLHKRTLLEWCDKGKIGLWGHPKHYKVSASEVIPKVPVGSRRHWVSRKSMSNLKLRGAKQDIGLSSIPLESESIVP